MQLIFNSLDQYHTGYQEQMSRWPEQPVNIIMKWLKDHPSSLVVADFGCGMYICHIAFTFLIDYAIQS